MKVLLVEDEKRLAAAVRYLLKENKTDCDVAYDGESGLNMAEEGDYGVIVLDIMLPGKDGFEVLKQLREDGINTPVLMLTAKDQVSDKIKGLNLGADDYLTKPFDADELVARVNALSRRSGVVVMDKLTFGDLTLVVESGELSAKGETVKLNYKEKEIIKLFMISHGATISKDALIEKVWGWDSDAESNNVEAYISFLRKKLRFLGSSVTIKNYQKLGYRLEVSGD